MSKSHQTCGCCGWSKVTSYQGLRIHQGKMGCTPKGLSIPQSMQYQYSPLSSYSPSYSYSRPAVSYTPPAIKKETYATPIYNPQPSTNIQGAGAETQETLRSCHCGWSKVTSYQGLRIHQGKMGCTPKGLGIPEHLQDLFKPSLPKYEVAPPKPQEKLRSVNNTSTKYEPQPSTKMRWDPEVESEYNTSNRYAQPALKLVPQSTSETTEASVKKENNSYFETPPQYLLARGDGTKSRRALNFSTIDKQMQRDQIKKELQQKIQSREQKLSEVRSSVKACESSLDSECLKINTVFSSVVHIVEEARQRALQPLENRKDKLKRDSQNLIEKIQVDIAKLEKAIKELDTTDYSDRIKDNSTWKVDTSFSFGTLRPTVSATMRQIQEELDQLAPLELKRAPVFAVDVKLDPATAHPSLVVSKDGKKVSECEQSQQLPLAAGRFDMFGSILGANRFSSGRAYWEVQVGGKSGWDLGVASAKANRKGKLTLSPDTGYWAIVHFEGQKYAALTAPPVCLQLKDRPQKVGVFLDYEEGLVSFYDVTNQSHIYSFTECSFDDSIFPYFSPHLKLNGKNSEPLVITAVKN